MKTARTLLVLGLPALFAGSSVSASAAHERYNPYAYLTLTTTGTATIPTATDTLIPIPVSTILSSVGSSVSFTSGTTPSTSVLVSTSVLTSSIPISTEPSSTVAPVKRSVTISVSATTSAFTDSSSLAAFTSASISASTWAITSDIAVTATVVSSLIPTATTTGSASGIDVVAVDPPLETSVPPYMANTFFASWHAVSPSSAGFDSATGSTSGTTGGAPGESGRTFGLDDLQWDLLYSVTYGFIPIPITNFANITLSLQDASLLPQFVTMAKEKNVTSIISFGGWISSPTTGGSSSSGFPLALASPSTIDDFVTGVTGLVTSLGGVGGVEFDWEYTECSTDTPYTDPTLATAYLTFLQKLRASLDPATTISLAVGVVPFETPQIVSTVNGTTSNSSVPVDTPIDSNALAGVPDSDDGEFMTVATTLTGEYKNVSAFAAVVDYITVMNFDLYGPWSTAPATVMPNSPLNGTCSSAPVTTTPTVPDNTTIPITSTTSTGSVPITSTTFIGSVPITSTVSVGSIPTAVTSGLTISAISTTETAVSTSSVIADAAVDLSTSGSLNDTTSLNTTITSDNSTSSLPTTDDGSGTSTVSTPLPVYATTAIASWIMSGFRPDQIVLGVSSSGRSYRVPTANAISPNDADSLIAYPTFSTDDGTLVSSSNVTVTDGTAVDGTLATGTASNGTLTTGTVTNGTLTTGAATNGTSTTGTTANGTVTTGAATNGTVTTGTATNGTDTTGTATNGTVTTGAATNGTGTAGTATNGTTSADSTDLGDVWWWGDIGSSLTSTSTSNSTGNDTTTPTVSATCSLSSTLSTISGVFTYNGLLDAGFLGSDGLPADCGPDGVDSGFVGGWDVCSQTPFVYNTKTQVLVSYDDAESMEIKGAFVLASGLRGFSLYEAGGDSATATLLTALRLGAGFPDLTSSSNSANSTASSTTSSAASSTTNSTTNSTSDSSVSQYDWAYTHNSTTSTGTNGTSSEIGAVDWQEILQSAVDALEVTLSGSSGNSTSDDTGEDTGDDTGDDIGGGSNSTSTTTAALSTSTDSGSANPYIS
ncbi:hypothetical protein FRB94_007648 [Tulasnella sp. JGI-2019a]|nr:hypothetical protein FRB94_007648 [Tulasnella sp. JGI-2019a]